jgi:syndecan 4
MKKCHLNCSGNGICLGKLGQCKCYNNFEGEGCENKKCSNNCSGNGSCNQGLCICSEGYLGKDCSIKNCPNQCSGKGFCNDGVCFCRPGYEGKDCSKANQSEDFIKCSIGCVNECIEQCDINSFNCFVTCSKKCTPK